MVEPNTPSDWYNLGIVLKTIILKVMGIGASWQVPVHLTIPMDLPSSTTNKKKKKKQLIKADKKQDEWLNNTATLNPQGLC